MDYRLDLLDDDKFEKLVVRICNEILGIGTISFAVGKDGGRDGKFTGTANTFPSIQQPWSGKFIIQAKHTANPIASCSDKDFRNLIIKTEVPKIVKLKEAKEVDRYLIFTNRKYSGVSGEALLKEIKNLTGLEDVVILGKETINESYISPNRKLIKAFALDTHHIPFDFSDEEIKEVIISFKSQLKKIKSDLEEKIREVKYDFDHIEKEVKNKKNNLTKEYYENAILAHSLMDFDKIQHFLDSEENAEIKDYYFDIAAELNHIITIKRDNFEAFEEIFSFIYKRICDGNTDIKGGKRHVLTLLHYIYMECLIGIK